MGSTGVLIYQLGVLIYQLVGQLGVQLLCTSVLIYRGPLIIYPAVHVANLSFIQDLKRLVILWKLGRQLYI